MILASWMAGSRNLLFRQVYGAIFFLGGWRKVGVAR